MIERGRQSFTLIELLVVISIIGILMTLVVAGLGSVQRRSRDARRKSDISVMRTGLDLFKADFKVYPNFTFILGDNLGNTGASNVGQTIDGGAIDSSFGLEAQILPCSTLTNGKPSYFVQYDSSPLHLTDLDYATLKPGFDSINHLLICLKYMEPLLKDPISIDALGFQYRVSFDYQDMLVSATFENLNDTSIQQLSPDNSVSLKRYYEGNGKTVRQLDEDSDTSRFFNSFTINSANDGKYLYQCLKNNSSVGITRDDRSSANYQPLIFDTTTNKYNANTSCHNLPDDLRVVQAYGIETASSGTTGVGSDTGL